MKDLNNLIGLALEVKQYVEVKGSTYAISQGKMLKDEVVPEDLKQFLKIA